MQEKQGLSDMGNLDAVIVSDIHIRDQQDQKFATFCTLLENLAQNKVSHLFLLGDIFDFCLGRSSYFHKKFAPIGERLTKLTQKDCRVVFFEGNHEFDAMDLPWEGVEFIYEGDHLFELDNGTKLLLAHGDLVYSHRLYKAFRSLVKTRLVKSVAASIPGAWVDRFALGNADISRHADNYRTLDHADIKVTMTRWADSHECDYAFFGHLHYPYAFPRDNGGWIASCGSWEAPSILAVKDGKLYRSIFELNETAFNFSPVNAAHPPDRV